MKFLFLIILFSFLNETSVHAEKIILKNGKMLQGKIIEQTSSQIKIEDNQGITSYSLDEVNSMFQEGDPIGQRSTSFEGAMVTSELRALLAAIKIYHLDHGSYPPMEVGLKALIEDTTESKKWSGPYVWRTEFIDPWGREYVYIFPGKLNTQSFDLYSLGPDGIQSEDDIKFTDKQIYFKNRDGR